MRKLTLLSGIVLAAALFMSGCSSTPDTVEDPLSAFGIDAVLPFATVAPEAIVLTPTPAPTPDVDNLPTTDYGQSWKSDDTVTGEESLDDDDGWFDAVVPPSATPKPTPKPTAKPSTGYERLASGDSGAAVKNLQNRLKKLGYYTGTVDGQYGSGTVTAVRKFQEMTGYNENGIASAELQKEIYSSNAPTYRAPVAPEPTAQYIQLSKGDSGSRVTRLQNRLRTLGYYTGTADGEYGSATVNAVKRFQSSIGLSTTGTATVALQQKLFSSSAPYYEEDEDEPEVEPEGYVRLAQGSSGTRVKNLQSRLKTLGYYTGTADGAFGAGTARAVKLFQKALGQDTTGVATAALQRTLFSSSAPYYDGFEDEPEYEEEYILLSPGDSGTEVKKLQKRLKDLGYFDGEVLGNYLAKTTDAVKLFQKAIGVKQTGAATAALQKKLFSSTAPKYKPDVSPAPSGYSDLSEGDSGNSVMRLQERLTELGYYSGSINGNFGSKTSEAVARFEARYGKPKTGIATAALQKKLFADDALPNKQTDPTSAPTPSGEYQKLQKGDSGTNVKQLQRRLKELGYFEGAIGGNYQQLTTDAVKLFQAALGVKQNGVASIALQEILFSDDAPVYQKSVPTPAPYKKLQRGDTGDAVLTLQQRLLELGYIRAESEVKPRTFDKNTMLAVIDAQNDRGYDSDGVADVDFLTYIYSDTAWDYALADYEGG